MQPGVLRPVRVLGTFSTLLSLLFVVMSMLMMMAPRATASAAARSSHRSMSSSSAFIARSWSSRMSISTASASSSSLIGGGRRRPVLQMFLTPSSSSPSSPSSLDIRRPSSSFLLRSLGTISTIAKARRGGRRPTKLASTSPEVLRNFGGVEGNDGGGGNDENGGSLSSSSSGGDKIVPIELNTELSTSFMQYAMSTILGRALPDARDGLKPVHRRILYAMHVLNLQPESSYRKCARVVGEVLGR